jgi:hypothetical protein
MANAMYPVFKELLLQKAIDCANDSFKATLIDSADYTYDSADESYATDVASGAKVAASAALTSPTEADGVFDTADFTWSSVTGDQCEAVILWDDTPTTPTADPLAVFYDTGMTGMPVTPSGGDISFTVNASGWFSL